MEDLRKYISLDAEEGYLYKIIKKILIKNKYPEDVKKLIDLVNFDSYFLEDVGSYMTNGLLGSPELQDIDEKFYANQSNCEYQYYALNQLLYMLLTCFCDKKRFDVFISETTSGLLLAEIAYPENGFKEKFPELWENFNQYYNISDYDSLDDLLIAKYGTCDMDELAEGEAEGYYIIIDFKKEADADTVDDIMQNIGFSRSDNKFYYFETEVYGNYSNSLIFTEDVTNSIIFEIDDCDDNGLVDSKLVDKFVSTVLENNTYAIWDVSLPHKHLIEQVVTTLCTKEQILL